MELDRVLEVWRRSPAQHDPAAGATDAVLARAERLLGRPLPAPLAELHRVADGGSFLGHELWLLPLLPNEADPDGLTVATAGDLLRSWEWPVPDEMIVVATHGGGDPIGLWVPAGEPGARPVVVHLGQVFEEGSLAVIAEDLGAFLVAWTACYLPLAGGPDEALDHLGPPGDLRRTREEDEPDDLLDRLLHWASPGLPPGPADPYEQRWTAEDVDRFARGV